MRLHFILTAIVLLAVGYALARFFPQPGQMIGLP